MKRVSFAKKIKSWINGGGVLLLSNISLVSIGFASWSVIMTDSKQINQNVIADNVEVQKIVEVGSFSSDYKISKDGLVKDHVLCQEGTFSISFTVNNELASSYKSSSGKLSVTASLIEETNTNLLTKYVTTKKPTCSDSSATVGDNSSTDNKKIKNLITFTPAASGVTTEITLTYKISDPDCTIGELFEKQTDENQQVIYQIKSTLTFSVSLEKQ